MCRFSGVGDTGPYVKKRVYDPVIQSLIGLSGRAGGPGQRAPTDDPHHRRRQDDGGLCRPGGLRGPGGTWPGTGEGQHICLSMLDTMVAFLWPEAMTQYTIVGREKRRQPDNRGPT